MNKLIHIGFGNIVNAGKIIAIVSPDSAPVKRLVQKARETGDAIDATQGRKTKAVLVMENSQLVLSALLPELHREHRRKAERKMKRKGILIVVSGFSGTGKGTLMKELVQSYDDYALSVSMTTRSPRPGEEEGKEYFFVSREEFVSQINNDGLIEYASYCEHYYGTPREYVEAHLEAGKDVILEIEIQGALKVKEKYPTALLLFVMPPNACAGSSRNTVCVRYTPNGGKSLSFCGIRFAVGTFIVLPSLFPCATGPLTK